MLSISVQNHQAMFSKDPPGLVGIFFPRRTLEVGEGEAGHRKHGGGGINTLGDQKQWGSGINYVGGGGGGGGGGQNDSQKFCFEFEPTSLAVRYLENWNCPP